MKWAATLILMLLPTFASAEQLTSREGQALKIVQISNDACAHMNRGFSGARSEFVIFEDGGPTCINLNTAVDWKALQQKMGAIVCFGQVRCRAYYSEQYKKAVGEK